MANLPGLFHFDNAIILWSNQHIEENMNLAEQYARLAFSAFLHDLGKLAERAGIDHGGRLDAHKTL